MRGIIRKEKRRGSDIYKYSTMLKVSKIKDN